MLTRACRSSSWSVRAGPPSGATVTIAVDVLVGRIHLGIGLAREHHLVSLVAQSLREQERVLENNVFFLQGDASIFDADIPEILTAVTGVDADDVPAVLGVQLVDAGHGHGGRGRRRRLRVGVSASGAMVSPSAWGVELLWGRALPWVAER